ncbi:MAG TPA: hypothetical protein VJR29_11410 [bacterium]|nr:hypothetical protein [bacterium]
MKRLILLILSSLIFSQISCGGCPTREITQDQSNGIDFSIVVNDENGQTFTEDIEFNGTYPSGTFQLNTAYIFDTRPFPQDHISFQYFFRNTALPNGEDIFDQMAGEVFTFTDSPYEGENVIYEETAPQLGEWIPTSYSGTVTFTSSTHVQFDLTFTDGVQSREVLALFFFDTVTFDQPIGECD